MDTITSLLREVQEGREDARDRLYEHVYDELKTVARKHLRSRRAGVLQTTALVNAAYERLAAKEVIEASDRRQFFYFLSRAMHDILVDQVRAELALKRGGDRRRVTLVEIAADRATQQVDIMDLHEALAELGAVDSDATRVIMLRFYGGLTLEETAEAMNESFAVVRRNWEYAKAWLHERLSRTGSRPSEHPPK